MHECTFREPSPNDSKNESNRTVPIDSCGEIVYNWCIYKRRGIIVDERGRLDFSNLDNIQDNEELLKMKKQWEAFASMEQEERDKYLRELEIQFSLNEIVSGENKSVDEASASFFSDEKIREAVAKLRGK